SPIPKSKVPVLTAVPGSGRKKSPARKASRKPHVAAANGRTIPVPNPVLKLIETTLDDAKAEEIVTIDLANKTSIDDYMVIATGRAQRQLSAMADHLVAKLKKAGTHIPVEGKNQGDWVLVDAGDVIVHLFRPEARAHYNLEKMWAMVMPEAE